MEGGLPHIVISYRTQFVVIEVEKKGEAPAAMEAVLEYLDSDASCKDNAAKSDTADQTREAELAATINMMTANIETAFSKIDDLAIAIVDLWTKVKQTKKRDQHQDRPTKEGIGDELDAAPTYFETGSTGKASIPERTANIDTAASEREFAKHKPESELTRSAKSQANMNKCHQDMTTIMTQEFEDEKATLAKNKPEYAQEPFPLCWRSSPRWPSRRQTWTGFAMMRRPPLM